MFDSKALMVGVRYAIVSKRVRNTTGLAMLIVCLFN